MGGDLSRRARRLQHTLFRKLFGVGIAGGHTAHDPDPQTKHDGPSNRTHTAFLKGEVAGGSVLEVEIRVLSARGQRRAQQPLRDASIDGIDGCGGKRKGGVRVHFIVHESASGGQS